MKTTAELMAALPHVLAAPKDAVPVLQLCFRPGYNLREFPRSLSLTRSGGIPGERWATAPWKKLEDGTGDPRIQVSILSKRVLDLVWKEGDAAPHPGDPIIADLDTSVANLPEGTLLSCGTAVLKVSGIFNEACTKWRLRYGDDAKEWITAPGHAELRLRGILCSIEQDGEVRLGDLLRKL